MRRIGTSARRARGFTLIELLIALTLFAVLSVLLFGSLRFGMRASAAGTAQLEWSAEVAGATGFLRAQLADAQPFEEGDAAGPRPIAFDGSSDSVDFVAPLPAYLAPGGWHKLRLGLESQGGSAQLVIRWALLRSETGGGAISAPHRSVLLDSVKTVEFGYFGTVGQGETPTWHERWHNALSLPTLVRMRATFADGRRAPELIVALRAAGPSQDLF